MRRQTRMLAKPTQLKLKIQSMRAERMTWRHHHRRPWSPSYVAKRSRRPWSPSYVAKRSRRRRQLLSQFTVSQARSPGSRRPWWRVRPSGGHGGKSFGGLFKSRLLCLAESK